MSDSQGSTTSEFLGKMRAGTSFWTTFRWLADIVYGICWMIALPVELLLNRRMGRRYNSMLPLTIAMLLMVGLYAYFDWGVRFAREAQARLQQPVAMQPLQGGNPFLRPQPPAMNQPNLAALQLPSPLISGQTYFLPALVGVIVLAMLAHRVDNWWRFRSTEQVHSRNCGIPHWVWWLWAALARGTGPSGIKPAEVIEAKPGSEVAVRSTRPASFAASVRSSFVTTLRGFTNGVPPTGTLAWIASTIVHPLTLWLASGLIARVDFVIATHLAFAGLAIFLKARIQKALVVETIYDVFDARIERTFMRGLESPTEMAAASRAGMIVPGVAEIMTEAISRLPKQSALSPEYQALVTAIRAKTH